MTDNAARVAGVEDGMSERDVIINPEAVGDPAQTPIVELSDGALAYFERTRCPECRQINYTHAADCPATVVRDESGWEQEARLAIRATPTQDPTP